MYSPVGKGLKISSPAQMNKKLNIIENQFYTEKEGKYLNQYIHKSNGFKAKNLKLKQN
jgi:hypothetical protein